MTQRSPPSSPHCPCGSEVGRGSGFFGTGGSETLTHKVKVALSSGNRQGGVLAYDFSSKTRHINPLVSDCLQEGGEGGTAERAMVV